MTSPVSGTTTVACIIGHPVAHSLSPAIHNAAFAAAGIDWLYAAFDVSPASLHAAVEGLRALGVAGANVTMPHKQAIVPLLDAVDDQARALGAVNTIVNRAGRLTGRNTDGEGFVRFLRRTGIEPSGARVLLLGAGGAARALAAALGAAGATVAVAARRGEHADAVAALAGTNGHASAWDQRDREAAQAQIVVNATPLGTAGEESPVDIAGLQQGTSVVDLVYGSTTRLVEDARKAGLSAHDGLGMLVQQAALSFEAWTQIPAPLAAMEASVRDITNTSF